MAGWAENVSFCGCPEETTFNEVLSINYMFSTPDNLFGRLLLLLLLLFVDVLKINLSALEPPYSSGILKHQDFHILPWGFVHILCILNKTLSSVFKNIVYGDRTLHKIMCNF